MNNLSIIKLKIFKDKKQPKNRKVSRLLNEKNRNIVVQ